MKKTVIFGKNHNDESMNSIMTSKEDNNHEKNEELITQKSEPELILSYDESDYDKSKEYHDQKLRQEIIARIINPVLYLIITILSIPSLFLHIGPTSTEYGFFSILWVTFILGFIIWAITIPLSYYNELLERRYGFAKRTTKRWIRDQVVAFILQMIYFIIIIEGIYALIHNYPIFWWFYSFLGYFVIISIVLTIFPIFIVPLFMKLEPLSKGKIREAVEKLAQDMNLKYKDIYLAKMSQITTKANAAVIGFGKTIRIVLGDTLIENFRTDEIEVVMAHEIGHQQNKDTYLGVLYSGIFTLIVLLLIDQIFQIAINIFNYEGKDDPASIGFFLFAMLLLFEFLSGFFLALSRMQEKRADIVAIKQTRNLDAYCSAFRRLAKQSLSYPNPSKLEILFRYSHPPIYQRIAYGKEAYEKL